MGTYIHIYTYTYAHINKHTHIHRNTNTYTHVHTHRQTNTNTIHDMQYITRIATFSHTKEVKASCKLHRQNNNTFIHTHTKIYKRKATFSPENCK